MSRIVVAAVQIACADDISDNLDRLEEQVRIAETRRSWCVFRDRRPDLYGRLIEPSPEELMPRSGWTETMTV